LDNAKAICRHPKALVGLKKYDLTSNFTREKQKEYSEIEKFQAIKNTVESVNNIFDIDLSQPVVVVGVATGKKL